MSAKKMPAFGEIQALVAPMRLGIGASELHGSITGYLGAGGQPDADDWLATLALESADAGSAAAARPALAALAAATAAGIRPKDPNLELLLPPEDDGLEARALALVDWCRGFLGGFGLSGIAAEHLEPGMAGILEDFSHIAATVPDMGEREEDRAALNELIDHVRFGVLLLHANLTMPEGTTRQ